MIVYLVIDRGRETGFQDWVFGVFTDKAKAEEIKRNRELNCREHGEDCTVEILESELDQPTEDYYWFMSN